MTPLSEEERLDLLRKFNQRFMGWVPHNKALGIELVSLDVGEAVMKLPYDERLVGNPETGVIHGGAITSMMDACCGAAVFMKQRQPVPIATLALRIDYPQPPAPREPVLARATCYKENRNVAFVRCLAYQQDEQDPLASAAGTFMLSTSAPV